MGTSRKWKKEDNKCLRCGISVEPMTRVQQDEHIEWHKLKDLEDKKQTKLI